MTFRDQGFINEHRRSSKEEAGRCGKEVGVSEPGTRKIKGVRRISGGGNSPSG